MNNTQKGFIIPLVAIAIVLLGAGIYYATRPSSDDAVPVPLQATTTDEGEVVGDAGPAGKIPATKGITVTSPMPNDLIMLPLKVTGSVNGIGWFANEGEAGSVEIFDANGTSIANKTVLMTTTDWRVFPAQFEATIGDREMMSHINTDTGVVRFTNHGAKNGDAIQMLEVPVRFR